MTHTDTDLSVDQPLRHVADATMFWSPSSGGVRRYLLAKQEWVARRADWRQTIVTPVASGEGMRLVGGLPLPGSGGYRFPVARHACASVLAELEPDVIEAGDPYRLAWSTLDAASRLKAPSVAFCHSNLEAMARRAARVLGRSVARKAARMASRYVRHLYDRFDLVLAPSNAMREHLLEIGLTNVQHQPLGVDSTRFSPALRDAAWRHDWCTSLGLPADARLLLYVGRFASEKNLEVLTGAVRLLGSPYVLLAVGAGPMPPSGDRVLVRPYESDRSSLARLLANVDVMVHAGDQETFGLSVLEAMASGTPVVAMASDGLAELVDEEVGASVTRLDASAFAAAIRSVCEAPEEQREALMLAARTRAVRYDWEQVFPSLFARYSELISSGS